MEMLGLLAKFPGSPLSYFPRHCSTLKTHTFSHTTHTGFTSTYRELHPFPSGELLDGANNQTPSASKAHINTVDPEELA